MPKAKFGIRPITKFQLRPRTPLTTVSLEMIFGKVGNKIQFLGPSKTGTKGNVFELYPLFSDPTPMLTLFCKGGLTTSIEAEFLGPF